MTMPPPATAPPAHRTVRFWLAPLVVVGALLSLLAVVYLAAMLHPQDNLRDYPLAVVNQDRGTSVPAGDGTEQRNLGDDITAGLLANIPADKVALRELTFEQAQNELYTGKLYGAIVIPPEFSSATVAFAAATAADQGADRPTITVYTNPSAGSVTVSLTQAITDPALAEVNRQVGAQLTEMLAAQAGDVPLSGPQLAVLAEPVDVRIEAREQLPDGTGYGLSAFYFALLLTLAGFTGATIIHTLVDSMLGFTHTEVGPRYLFRARTALSRTQVLLVKWTIVLAMAAVAASLYLAVGALLDMFIPNPAALWGFSVLVITAVGVTATSVMALFGSMGMLVNLVVFIVLGLPSSGGTLPLQASPEPYTWLARVEPLRHIVDGTRALLYFHGRPDAGLGHAVLMAVVGLVFGLLLGLAATRFYDRRGLHRAPAG